MAEDKIERGGITASESELNDLFKETLDGIRDDIIEAIQNAEMYYDSVLNETGGKEVYGSAYNEALKIKGNARARQLSFLNMFKDRVAVKEKMNEAKKEATSSSGIGGFDHSTLNKFIEEYESDKEVQNPIIQFNDNDDEDDDDIDDNELDDNG